MVDAPGHAAFGLLFAIPAWFRWNDRASVTFVVLAVGGALLPDVDVWLAAAFPNYVHHHGVVHTVLFVTIASLVGGAIFAGVYSSRFDSWFGNEEFDSRRLFAFASMGFLTGGLSHLVADIISAPDISTPIEPFWPLLQTPIGLDLVWYNAAWINAGFLSVMVLTHVALAYLTTPADRRHRLLPT